MTTRSRRRLQRPQLALRPRVCAVVGCPGVGSAEPAQCAGAGSVATRRPGGVCRTGAGHDHRPADDGEKRRQRDPELAAVLDRPGQRGPLRPARRRQPGSQPRRRQRPVGDPGQPEQQRTRLAAESPRCAVRRRRADRRRRDGGVDAGHRRRRLAGPPLQPERQAAPGLADAQVVNQGELRTPPAGGQSVLLGAQACATKA